MLAYAFLVKLGVAGSAALITFLIVMIANAVSAAANKVAEAGEGASKKNAGCQECA